MPDSKEKVTETSDEEVAILSQDEMKRMGLRRRKKPERKEDHPSSDISLWKPKPEEEIVEYDGKLCIIHFERVFNEEMAKYSKFTMAVKDACAKKLDLICHYLNYFIAKYDQENEFLTAYSNLACCISVESSPIYFTADQSSMNQFLQYIYDILFTPTIVEKVRRLVDDNYLDDIEKDDTDAKYNTKEKKHLESLEFTNEQVKIMLCISFGMKMMSPVLFQYLALNKIKVDKKSNLLFKFFYPLFATFTPPDMDVYNKLFVYVKKKVLENESANSKIFRMRELLGVDEYNVIAMFVQNVVISDNFVKLKFSEKWNAATGKYSENVTGFIKTVVKIQFSYYLRIQHAKTFTELTYTKNADGLSGIDKLEMSSDKIDEGISIVDKECARDAIISLRNSYKFNITEEEIDYYIKNWVVTPFHQNMVYSWMANIVGSYRACYSFTRREFIELAIMLRNRLLISSGIEDYRTFTDKVTFPYLIMANIEGKVNTRIIRNSQFSEECDSSYIIQSLIQNKYKLFEEIEPNAVMMFLSRLNNSTFTYCVYEAPEMLGEPINTDRDRITDAGGYFLRVIT